MDRKIRSRIAPSPTGSPHIGTAYAALFNYCFAKQNNGDFVLRIEDTDRSRYVEGSEEEIFEALKWLGLEPDESPQKDGNFGPYRQSERLSLYKENLENLIKAGKAYYCDCSAERLTKIREEQQAKNEVPHYDRKCRTNPPQQKEGLVIRLAVPQEGQTVVNDKIRGEVIFQNSNIDDQVLLKSDGYPTYHLASVVDDHLMEITHVIRAEEWLSSTPKHVLLYQAFGWKVPEFAHLPLLRNPDKSKISKRKNPVAVSFYKDEGFLPEAITNFLGLMGWSMPDGREIFALEEMVKEFTFERIDPSGPVFDIQKLTWLNGEYIRSFSDGDLAKRIKPYSKFSLEQITKVLPLVKERLKKLNEFDQLTHYFFDKEISLDPQILLVKGDKNKSKELISEAKELFTNLPNWNKEEIHEKLEAKVESLDVSKTDFYQLIRAAATGSKASPPLYETLEEMGKDLVLSRLESASSLISK